MEDRKEVSSPLIFDGKLEICSQCKKSFGHRKFFIDHLFLNKECMRRYWAGEEEDHSYRLRRRLSRHNAAPEKKSGVWCHSRSCYVVEEVAGKTIYTSWDKEEALQLADQLLVSGKETNNNLAVRRVSCSLIPPPMTETGAAVKPLHEKETDSSFSCPEKTFPAIGYCIEKFDAPSNADIGSLVRKRLGDHFMVCIGVRGSWDPIREKYFKLPHVYEIWHPRNENHCTIKTTPS